MLKNYFKIAIRNLIKNKTFSIINIFGMTVGMASFMLIGLYVWDDLQYDQYYKDKDRTYRLYDVITRENGATNHFPAIPPTFGPTLKKEYPEIESTLRIMDVKQDVMLTIEGENTYVSGAIYAEPTAFDILDIELIKGNPETALNKPDHIVISEDLSQRIFDDRDPVGELIELSENTYTISGVYKNIPSHSHLDVPLIMSFASFEQYIPKERMNSWRWHQFFTYVKFHNPIDEVQFERKLEDFIANHPLDEGGNGIVYESYLQKISDIYLHSSNFEWDFARHGNAYTVYALLAAAIFIIIIVCLNFINLSTTQSMSRMKEVGVRKVIGAGQKYLILQFIGESVILALISVVLAGFIAELSFTFLNDFTGKQLGLKIFSNPAVLIGILLFALILGIFAGLYPAIYASRFNPLSVLGGKGSTAKKGSSSFRSTMVVIQFALSTFLIIVSVVVYQQVNFLRHGELGFNKDHIITFLLKSGLRKNLETTKQLFLEHHNVTAATYSFGLPGDIVAGDNIINPSMDKPLSVNQFLTDHDYITTMGLQVIAGRDFNKELVTDASEAFVINETAVKSLGYDSPENAIGKPLHWDMWHYDSLKKGRVIGVVKDFHFKSMREEISPSVIQIYPESYYKIALKLKPENINETIQFIEKTYAELEPTWPISYSFIDQDFDKMYKSEKRLGTLITIFTGIGIFIACLGLFGLVSYSTQMRLKEIGIRKVLGANVRQVVGLLTRSYLLLLMIAFIAAIPLSHYTMKDWLSGFAYRVEISPTIFIISIAVVALIALLSVSYQSIRAALTNPVNVLKDE